MKKTTRFFDDIELLNRLNVKISYLSSSNLKAFNDFVKEECSYDIQYDDLQPENELNQTEVFQEFIREKIILLAFYKKRLTGFLIATHHSANGYTLNRLFVAPRDRYKKVGSQLIDKLKHELWMAREDRGAILIDLTDTSNSVLPWMEPIKDLATNNKIMRSYPSGKEKNNFYLKIGAISSSKNHSSKSIEIDNAPKLLRSHSC